MHITKRIGFWLFIGGILFALLPVASVLFATGLTAISGCDVNEGFAQTCTFLGMDIGELLYTLFVSGWYAFMTIPLGGIAAVVGLIMYIVGKIGSRTRSTPTVPMQ